MKVPNLRTMGPTIPSSDKTDKTLENGAKDSLSGDNDVEKEYRTKGGVPKTNTGGENTAS